MRLFPSIQGTGAAIHIFRSVSSLHIKNKSCGGGLGLTWLTVNLIPRSSHIFFLFVYFIIIIIFLASGLAYYSACYFFKKPPKYFT